MQTLPAITLLSAAAGLGLLLGWQYLHRVRRKPTLIATHLILGAGGLEVTAVLVRGTPDGTVIHSGLLGTAAALLLAAAMMSGLATPMVGRRWPKPGNIVLATHAAVGALGFIVFLAWAMQA